MKINKVQKIDEHFNEIKTESIFAALKEKRYIGYTRSEISRLLEKHNIDQVFAKLKIRYRKRIYLLICFISLFSFLIILSGISLFSYISVGELILLRYLDISYYNELQLRDYSILSLFSLSIITIILCMYEIILRVKNFKY